MNTLIDKRTFLAAIPCLTIGWFAARQVRAAAALIFEAPFVAGPLSPALMPSPDWATVGS
ncbi:MAG: hypothetical protein SGJ01_18865 [Gemmatimonadota bacterium]|nr:hypothetical protein [Gemmatimonadota bacterium]